MRRMGGAKKILQKYIAQVTYRGRCVASWLVRLLIPCMNITFPAIWQKHKHNYIFVPYKMLIKYDFNVKNECVPVEWKKKDMIHRCDAHLPFLSDFFLLTNAAPEGENTSLCFIQWHTVLVVLQSISRTFSLWLSEEHLLVLQMLFWPLYLSHGSSTKQINAYNSVHHHHDFHYHRRQTYIINIPFKITK